MKSLELNLNKRLLIVEGLPEDKISEKKYFDDGEMFIPIKFICSGSDLTEEIAAEMVETGISKYLVEWAYDYKNKEQLNTDLFSPIDSFISAIEASGYFWIDNPLRKPDYSIEWYDRSPSELERYENDMEKYMDAESRTFLPERVIIFEIVEGQS